MSKVAILVDGGFYRKKAKEIKGEKTPAERAEELYQYCNFHLKDSSFGKAKFGELYRIFYYDCPPIDKQVYNPLTQKTIDFSKSDVKKWTEEFFEILAKKRKLALRLGELSENSIHYSFNAGATKRLLKHSMDLADVTQRDLELSLQQKGVDMRIGIDIASLSFKQQVDKIVLIAGDSDFVPAAKLARREGIDFVLDPLGNPIRHSLSVHIDGLHTCDNEYLQPHRTIAKA